VRREVDPEQPIRAWRDVLPVVSPDPMGPAALPTADSHAWFTETAATHAPAWHNEVTVRSLDLFLRYDPASLITLISPTPLLMIVGLADHPTPADLALAAYERALQPKRLVILDSDARPQGIGAYRTGETLEGGGVTLPAAFAPTPFPRAAAQVFLRDGAPRLPA
jgi:fermentation-respiration switch protein FrsA (DUF1100 family)